MGPDDSRSPDLTATNEGVGFNGSGAMPIWLTTTAIPLGSQWRPTYIAGLKVKLNGIDSDLDKQYGGMYARYSPDHKHWSNWQELSHPEPCRYEGNLRVPYKARQPYDELLQQYARRDEVPWGSDEEAAVKWILEKNPKFFEEHQPFIGYVEVLYENIDFPGGQRIKSIEVEAQWETSGMHTIPKDPEVYKNRGGSWRFRADE